MSKDVAIENLMTGSPHTIGLKQTLKLAKDTMREHSIRHLVVSDGVRAMGVVSDRDITYALSVEKKESTELTVEDVYTDDPYTVTPDTPVSKVVSEMGKNAYGCAIVKDRDRLVGIFTTVDACNYLAEVLK